MLFLLPIHTVITPMVVVTCSKKLASSANGRSAAVPLHNSRLHQRLMSFIPNPTIWELLTPLGMGGICESHVKHFPHWAMVMGADLHRRITANQIPASLSLLHRNLIDFSVLLWNEWRRSGLEISSLHVAIHFYTFFFSTLSLIYYSYYLLLIN